MSGANSNAGRGRSRHWGSDIKRAHQAFDAAAANAEMADKLRRNSLRRRARANGLELRHSDYGYSLIDSGRNRLDGRNDLTLDEVDARLDDTSGAR